MDDGVVSDEAAKRQLPLWMLGDQTNNKSETVSLNNGDNDDVGNRADEERVNKRGRKPKSKSCDIGHDDGGLEEESLGVLRRCRERKKRRREMFSHDAGINGEVMSNKKRKGRSRKSLDVNNNMEFEGCAENGDDDDDLTMEDLLSIAKEFVQEDEDAQPVVSLKHGHRVGTQSQNIESGSSVRVPQGNFRSFQDQGTSSSIALENLASKVANCNPTMSGNPTQDMLDLFLGPLLKKTQEGEKEGVLLADDINFTHEVKKHSFSVVHGEEPAIVMKKKTSLKDKVAMFLD